MRLELGCGTKPTEGYVHHDRWKHSPHVDLEFDLADLPWPLESGSVDEIRAYDVFEHLAVEIEFPLESGTRSVFVPLQVQQWLDECWRILKPGGLLNMRLPAYDNPYSDRDPTHQRVFHPESFLYWCPDASGTVWKEFGRFYFGPGYNKWWHQAKASKDDSKDLVFCLVKL